MINTRKARKMNVDKILDKTDKWFKSRWILQDNVFYPTVTILIVTVLFLLLIKYVNTV